MKKIEKQFVLNSSLWKPPDKVFKYKNRTNSWFDFNKLNSGLKNKEEIKIETNTIKSKSIPIFPSLKQRNILLNWFDIYRQVYNLTVKYLKTNKKKSYFSIRKIIDTDINKNPELLGLIKKYKIPKHMRDNAINDCLKAYKSSFGNLKQKNIKYFKIRYKKKSHHLSSVVLEPTMFSKKKNGFCISILKEMNSKENLINIDKESRLCYNSRTNKFCIKVPYEKVLNQTLKRTNNISLDPGMRTFQTCYTPSGNCYEICSEKTSGQIKNLIDRIENVKTENIRHKKFIARLREKISNKIADLHWKTSNFLCKKFNNIVVGNMSTKSIISKTKNLPKNVKKYCLSLSHFLFKQRLISKAEEYNCKVIISDESYTSKTCGGCGEINEKLGSNKYFYCGCGFKCGRDINGARNILLKYLSYI
jgi:IS605 OrfB family transposase